MNDPYAPPRADREPGLGDDSTDEVFERSLARGYAWTTWFHIASAFGLFVASCVVNPFLALTLFAGAASLSGVVRVLTMPRQLRAWADMLELVAQLVLAGGVCLLTLVPVALMALFALISAALALLG